MQGTVGRRTGQGAIRLTAFLIALTLGWSGLGACADVASMTATEQMACCEHGQHGCDRHGAPPECCRTAPAANLSPAVPHRMIAPAPSAAVAHNLAASLSAHMAGARSVASIGFSRPPHSKHPTYLVISILRL